MKIRSLAFFSAITLALAAFTAALALTPLLACAKENDPTKTTAKLSDGEFIGVLNIIDSNEVKLANTAQSKNLRAEVMDYAKTLYRDHSENMAKTSDLSKSTHIASADSPVSRKLRTKGEKEVSKLSQLDGAQFEKAYVKAMIKGHAEALSMLERQIPLTTNAELKKHLIEARSHIASHFEQAKTLSTTSTP